MRRHLAIPQPRCSCTCLHSHASRFPQVLAHRGKFSYHFISCCLIMIHLDRGSFSPSLDATAPQHLHPVPSFGATLVVVLVDIQCFSSPRMVRVDCILRHHHLSMRMRKERNRWLRSSSCSSSFVGSKIRVQLAMVCHGPTTSNGKGGGYM